MTPAAQRDRFASSLMAFIHTSHVPVIAGDLFVLVFVDTERVRLLGAEDAMREDELGQSERIAVSAAPRSQLVSAEPLRGHAVDVTVLPIHMRPDVVLDELGFLGGDAAFDLDHVCPLAVVVNRLDCQLDRAGTVQPMVEGEPSEAVSLDDPNVEM